MSDWQDVFQAELRKRRFLAKTNWKRFNSVHCHNPKGLKINCHDHVWVPATHLMIHSKTAKIIPGLYIRAFSEARPFVRNEETIVPQMCWNCSATSERVVSVSGHHQYKKIKVRKFRKVIQIEDQFTEFYQNVLKS